MSKTTQSFDTFDQWVNNAEHWLTDHPKFNQNYYRAVCFDSFGRILTMGKDFMRARDESAFPVYWVWPDQNLFSFIDSVERLSEFK